MCQSTCTFCRREKKEFETAPLHVTSEKKNQHVNLLLVQDHYVDEKEEEEEEGKKHDDEEYELPGFHYVWIKDLSCLVSTQLSKRGHKHYICDRCLHYLRTEEKLVAHENDCKKVNKCKVNMPTAKNNALQKPGQQKESTVRCLGGFRLSMLC